MVSLPKVNVEDFRYLLGYDTGRKGLSLDQNASENYRQGWEDGWGDANA